MAELSRIIAHWAVTRYTATALAKKHYHFIVEGDGTVVPGDHKPEANKRPRKGRYAAHTLNCNTGSIGISCAAMAGAKSVDDAGPYPITEVQFDAMCRKIADLCRKYGIPVTPKTVLSHAEVQKNLGIRQRGKWDIAVLTFAGLKTAKACGDLMRRKVAGMLGKAPPPKKSKPKPKKDAVPVLKVGDRGAYVRDAQEKLAAAGYDLDVDGAYGPQTRRGVEAAQHAAGIRVDGMWGPQTAAAVERLKLQPKIDEAEGRAVVAEKKVGKAKKAVDVAEKKAKGRRLPEWFTGVGTVVGGAWAAVSGIDWMTILAIVGAGVFIGALIVIFRGQIIAAYKDVRKAVEE